MSVVDDSSVGLNKNWFHISNVAFLKKVFVYLIIATVCLLLVVNLSEVIYLLKNKPEEMPTVKEVSVPGLKMIKDLFIILSLLLALWIQILRKKNLLILFLIPLYLLIGLHFVFAAQESIIYGISGIRWIIPFFLPILFADLIEREDLKKISYVLISIFVISFFIQLVEFYTSVMKFGFFNNNYGPGLSSRNRFVTSLSGRSPGIFFIPSTLAAFNCCLFVYLRFYYERNWIQYLFLLLLIPISTLLTTSGTGVICLFALILFTIMPYVVPRWELRLFHIYKFLAIPVLGAFLILLPIILGRATILKFSGLNRLMILKDLWDKTEIFSTHFGRYTNTLVSLSNYYNMNLGSSITESTWGNILGNFGRYGLIIAIVLGIVWIISMLFTKNKEFFAFSIVAFCFSFTSSISESFPLYLLLGVYFSYFISKSDLYRNISKSKAHLPA